MYLPGTLNVRQFVKQISVCLKVQKGSAQEFKCANTYANVKGHKCVSAQVLAQIRKCASTSASTCASA